MKIVIVGGSGFIGSRLTPRLLAGGHLVLIADAARSEAFPDLWKACDVGNPESLRACFEGADVVYNLAAVHHDNVRPLSRYHDVNVQGATNLCAAAEACGIKRIIFTSSVAIYGSSPREMDENTPANPENEYGRTKYLAEGVFRDWLARSADHSLTVIRPTAVFGEKNRGNVYNLLRSIQSKSFFVVGSGKNVKSIAYVENVAAFLQFVLTLPLGEATFNYVDKPDLTMNELVVVVRRALGRKAEVGIRIPYFFGYTVGMVFDCAAWILRRTFSISRQRMFKFVSTTKFSAERALATGFKPEYSLEDGLRRTIEYEFLKPSGDRPVI